jgi:hypothetical protein
MMRKILSWKDMVQSKKSTSMTVMMTFDLQYIDIFKCHKVHVGMYVGMYVGTIHKLSSLLLSSSLHLHLL